MTRTLLQPFVDPFASKPNPFRAVELPERGTTFVCDLDGPTPDAPVLVLLHGLMATGSLNWAPYLDDLNTLYRVIALDHRGHGSGILDSSPFTLESCADDVAALLRSLGIDQAILVGYSMGGPIAQLTWQRHPELVRGLVFCATASTFGLTPIDGLLLPFVDPIIGRAGMALSLLPPRMRSLLTRPALGLVVPDSVKRAEVAGALLSHHVPSIRAAIRAILGFSSADWLDQLSVPASVVLTERDRVVSPARQQKMLDLIPDAQAFRIDADHLACFTDPDAFGAALLAAVASVVDRTAPPSPAERRIGRLVGRIRARWRAGRSRRSRVSSWRRPRSCPRRR